MRPNWPFFGSCDFQIGRMTLQNNTSCVFIAALCIILYPSLNLAWGYRLENSDKNCFGGHLSVILVDISRIAKK